MRNTALALLFFPLAFFFSCSDDDVKSSENYIERFDIDISPRDVIIQSDLPARVCVWTSASNHEALQNKEPNIGVSSGASYFKSAGSWTEGNFQYDVNVIAEDGGIRSYSVKIDTTTPRKYSFESWTYENGYSTPAPCSRWTSGNPGISMALGLFGRNTNDSKNYPTRDTTTDEYGKAVLLETLLGGAAFGRTIPLLSGNFILGNFNKFMAIDDELVATEIGRIYPAKPKSIKGYYKYKEGPGAFISNRGVPPRNNDSCSMVVTFYRCDLPDGRDTTLTVRDRDGDNDLDLVIAETFKEDCSETAGNEFHPFELTLVYKSEPDFEKHRYKLGMTFAASKDGGKFSGKIGSKLIIDEIEVIDF